MMMIYIVYMNFENVSGFKLPLFADKFLNLIHLYIRPVNENVSELSLSLSKNRSTCSVVVLTEGRL